MKRRKFIETAGIASTIPLMKERSSNSGQDSSHEIYELRQYDLVWSNRKGDLANYFSTALIPALNKMGIQHVGVFEERGQKDPAQIYVLIAYPSYQHLIETKTGLWKDAQFLESSADFRQAPAAQNAYTRYTAQMMMAFNGYPVITKPPQPGKIFELRVYEGYNDDAVHRKVAMFNEGEIDIFLKTRLNPVFFGHSIAGDHLPNLTYMLWFDDYEERDTNWNDFINHPDWKAMSGMEKYANSVSRIHRTFLEPLDISQI